MHFLDFLRYIHGFYYKLLTDGFLSKADKGLSHKEPHHNQEVGAQQAS